MLESIETLENSFGSPCIKIPNYEFNVRFDSPDSKVNSLGVESSEELQECFRKFVNDSSAKSAVLMSGKPGCFIAGADINMLAACKTAEEATALSKGCQDLLFEVEKCSKPVVAAIQGKI